MNIFLEREENMKSLHILVMLLLLCTFGDNYFSYDRPDDLPRVVSEYYIVT